jgi:hypothetical protein
MLLEKTKSKIFEQGKLLHSIKELAVLLSLFSSNPPPLPQTTSKAMLAIFIILLLVFFLCVKGRGVAYISY